MWTLRNVLTVLVVVFLLSLLVVNTLPDQNFKTVFLLFVAEAYFLWATYNTITTGYAITTYGFRIDRNKTPIIFWFSVTVCVALSSLLFIWNISLLIN